jgi:LPXTG-motif cell wall-anchored protein
MPRLQPTMLAGFMAFLTTSALAQTAPTATAPATVPPATGSGNNWLWLILLVVLVGAAIWYFRNARNTSSTSSSTMGSTTTSAGPLGVDRDRVAGSARQAKGALEEGAGTILGDAKMQADGKLDQAAGKAQNTVGGIKDTLRGS